MTRFLCLLAFLAASPAWATDPEDVYSFAPTKTCLEQADSHGQRLDCVGRSAELCMDTAGHTTIVQTLCTELEYDDWDLMLNAAYRSAMRAAKEFDAEMAGTAPLSRAETLRTMQRAWIGYRDATCQFELAYWAGGTGGNPAVMACLLHETAEQTLYLQAEGESP